MNKIILVISIVLVSISCFGQKSKEDAVKPQKFASWTISEAFQAEAGFAGSYWKPTFNIAKDANGYYCVVNLYNADSYCSVNRSEALPHLFMKTDNGDIVDLEMDSEEPVHNFYLEGYYSSKIWMPGRYVSRFIYNIPDVDKFLSNNYVKYRVWLGEGFKDVEMTPSYAKKFNKRLKAAYLQATNKYNSKQNTLDNPLEGF